LLRDKGLTVDEIDLAKRALDEAAVRAIVKAAGSVEAVLNGRHALVKERGWLERPPDVAELARAVATEPNVLRRPILLRDGDALVGFDKATRGRWEQISG
jgi:arsenate reductase-like glutaredoxin family protein